MQVSAMIAMLIDHIGVVFFPDNPTFRVIGRIAFPIYAFALVMGYYHTSNLRNYLIRLAILAAISQLPFQWALEADGINVIAALLVSLLVLLAIDRIKPVILSVPIIIVAALLLELLNFDYGYYGLALVLIYRYAKSHMQLVLHLLINIITIVQKGWVIQMYSLLSTATLVYTPQFFTSLDRLRPPRWVWLSFYPGHLALLYLIREWMDYVCSGNPFPLC
ncbi:TraX family protein [Paenibacillus sp. GCM10012307]|uniref:Conjugal transfer protein TraX n=1 Tax=Paenibacillus roseus TaxID=2798579 RepID=A0A934J4M0_9BACL|nr:TraX family protein [Paenibacillus roseus]MBJ6361579.1 conjugal transfer protein TraX [Paenibacillus roseus]